jgi:class 3 adenylate cyclase
MPAPVVTEAVFDLPFPKEKVWKIFAKTDWLNRSLDLPEVHYSTEPLPEGGAAVFGSARIAGQSLRWREWPFEWVQDELYSVRREFSSGPLTEGVVGIGFTTTADGGTRLKAHSTLSPRNVIGAVVLRTVIAPRSAQAMARAVSHVAKHLAGMPVPILPKLPVSPLNEAALAERMARLATDIASPAVLEKFRAWLGETPDVELTHIRPKALARTWSEDPWDTLRTLLLATHYGLLQFRWEVLCPNCRSSREARTTSLVSLRSQAHCDVCGIRYDGDFDKSVELKFSVHPAVKKIEDQTFCLAGPGGKPHVIAQWLLAPAETRAVHWPTGMDGLCFRSPQVRQAFPVTRETLPDRSLVVAERQGFLVEETPSGHGTTLRNPNTFPVQVSLEQTAWDDDILTATTATNWQVFREHFAAEVISPDEQVVVGEQVVLFTDLRGSTAMYRAMGDAHAYARVRDHFSILRNAVEKHHGGIVKTIGDAVMAVFSDVLDAFQSMDAMFAGIETANAALSVEDRLTLKAGLHVGPCLAVNANDRLDYFGTTINLAARLVDSSRGGEAAISDAAFNRPRLRSHLGGRMDSASRIQLLPKGFAEPIVVWLLPMSGDGRQAPVDPQGQPIREPRLRDA